VKLLKWAALGCATFVLLLVGTTGAFLVSTDSGRPVADAVVHVVETDELGGASLDTEEQLLAYLAKHPDRYALAAWDVGHEDAGLFHDADRAWPLASTVKVIPLLAASEEVAAGRWKLDEPTYDAVDQLWLPGTDGDAHPQASADGGTETLGGALHGMIRFSDNAATDFVLLKLGRARVAARDGLPEPHPLGAALLLAEESLDGGADFDERAWARAAQQLEHKHRRKRTGTTLTLAQQEAFARTLDNRGTPRAFARLIERLYAEPVAPQTALARTELEWPMAFASNQQDFEVLATKGGSLPGVLTGATYGKTKSGQRRVVALFLHDLPFATWLGLTRSYAQQAVERDLLLNEDALERLRARLTSADAGR